MKNCAFCNLVKNGDNNNEKLCANLLDRGRIRITRNKRTN